MVAGVAEGGLTASLSGVLAAFLLQLLDADADTGSTALVSFGWRASAARAFSVGEKI